MAYVFDSEEKIEQVDEMELMPPFWQNTISLETDCTIAKLTLPLQCTLLPAEQFHPDPVPHCAFYVIEAAPLKLDIEIALPGALALPSLASGITLRASVDKYSIPCTSGYSETVPINPKFANKIKCDKKEILLECPVARLEGNTVWCSVSLPVELSNCIGAVDVWFECMEWTRTTVAGPFGEADFVEDVVPCEEVATLKQKRVAEPDKQEKKGRQGEKFSHEVRLTILRLVGKPRELLVLDPDVRRFEDFISFKHLFHACLWANNTPPELCYKPQGLVFQIVQNVRRYHERWYYGDIPSIGEKDDELGIPYPTDDISAYSYDVQNEGWNVLDNPDGGKCAAQCNQLATLYLDVLGVLGFPTGEVIELERIYTVHNGETCIRQHMDSYALHGLLCVAFDGVDWCFDTTVTKPPKRWFGTLLEAKKNKNFAKFNGEWRYISYRQRPVPDVLQGDPQYKPLTMHLPTSGAGDSVLPGLWGDKKGNIPYAIGIAGRQGGEGRMEADMDALMGKLRIKVVCGGAVVDGLRVDGELHYVVPKTDRDVVVAADKDANTDGADWHANGDAVCTAGSWRVPSDQAKRFEITCKLDGETEKIVLWIVWADIEVLMEGELPLDCPKSVDFTQSAVKTPGQHRKLGVFYSGAKAVGRVAAVCTLQPPGLEHALGKGWKMRRVISKEENWVDEDGYEIRLQRDDQPMPGTGTLRWSSNFGHYDRFVHCHFPFIDGGRQIAQC